METLLTILEFAGIVAFSVSGAMVAIDKEADLVGVIILALVTSFGGGIMRDLFLGNTPPAFFTEYTVQIIVCVSVALAVFFCAAIFKRKYVNQENHINAINNIVDALGLGIFAVAGAAIAYEAGESSPLIVISMGIISSVGGGLVRDLILRDIPFIIRKRIYVLAALAGAVTYYLLFFVVELTAIWSMLIGALVTFALRVLATIFKWNMPKAIKFSELE